MDTCTGRGQTEQMGEAGERDMRGRAGDSGADDAVVRDLGRVMGHVARCARAAVSGNVRLNMVTALVAICFCSSSRRGVLPSACEREAAGHG